MNRFTRFFLVGTLLFFSSCTFDSLFSLYFDSEELFQELQDEYDLKVNKGDSSLNISGEYGLSGFPGTFVRNNAKPEDSVLSLNFTIGAIDNFGNCEVVLNYINIVRKEVYNAKFSASEDSFTLLMRRETKRVYLKETFLIVISGLFDSSTSASIKNFQFAKIFIYSGYDFDEDEKPFKVDQSGFYFYDLHENSVNKI